MNPLLITTGIAAALAIPGGLAVTSPWIAHATLRPKKVFLTVPKHGTTEAIMKGGEDGGFIRFTPPPPGLKYKGTGDEFERWEVIDDPDYDSASLPELKFGDAFNGTSNPWEVSKHHFGWEFVGWPPNAVYRYPFKYRKVEEVNGKKVLVEQPEKESNFFFLINVEYGMIATNAETRDGIPHRVEFVAKIRITNPYIAAFGVKDWLAMVEAQLTEIVRGWVGGKTAAAIQSIDTSGSKDGELTDKIFIKGTGSARRPEETKQEFIQRKTGARVSDIYVINVDPDEKYRDITLQEAIARADAAATIIKADAEAYATEKAGDATAYAIEAAGEANSFALQDLIKAAKKGGDVGEVLRLVALMEAGKAGSVIVAHDLVNAGLGNLANKTKPVSEKGGE